MKVKIFVDWTEKAIMTEKQGKAELALRLKDRDSYEDYRGAYLDDIIANWLDDKEINSSEYFKKVFDLSTEEKAEIEAKCRKYYEEQTKQDFSSDWEEIEIEI